MHASKLHYYYTNSHLPLCQVSDTNAQWPSLIKNAAVAVWQLMLDRVCHFGPMLITDI